VIKRLTLRGLQEFVDSKRKLGKEIMAEPVVWKEESDMCKSRSGATRKKIIKKIKERGDKIKKD
jgi:hypothetical protein